MFFFLSMFLARITLDDSPFFTYLMPENPSAAKKTFSADWFMRGALTRIGDAFDRLTGRRWIPSSSLATSGLIERLKLLMDAEARVVPGKGTVVPHTIKLKMQWDKFSTDSPDAISKLENELLTAAVDHINDSLYYTYAPLTIQVKLDYFTEGVKLLAGYDTFADDEEEAQLNVTVAGISMPGAGAATADEPEKADAPTLFVARFEIGRSEQEKTLAVARGGRVMVGRSGTNGLVLDDESVSKMHASLALNSAGVLCVADTGSTNGTFINGQRIPYGKTMVLVDGDQVKFGLVEVSFERRPDASEADAMIEGAHNIAAGIDSLPTAASAPNDTVEIVPHTIRQADRRSSGMTSQGRALRLPTRSGDNDS